MPPPERWPGDWDCPRCGDFQFARNLRCRTCEFPGADSRLGSPDGAANPWDCYTRRATRSPAREPRPPFSVHPPASAWHRPGHEEPRSVAPPGRDRPYRTSIPHIERVPNSSVRGGVCLSEEAQDVSAPRVSRPPGQTADKAWLLDELEEQVRPRIRELLLRRAAPQRILWRLTEALVSELGRIRLPLSELEEDNLGRGEAQRERRPPGTTGGRTRGVQLRAGIRRRPTLSAL